MNLRPSSPLQTRSILVDLPPRKSGPVSRSRYSRMSPTLASGGRRTLSSPMSSSLLPLSANTALNPASRVRSTYRPGVTACKASSLLMPASPLPFPSHICPAALPPAESLLKFSIVKSLKVTPAMIAIPGVPGNKETSKGIRNRKICTRRGSREQGAEVAGARHKSLVPATSASRAQNQSRA